MEEQNIFQKINKILSGNKQRKNPNKENPIVHIREGMKKKEQEENDPFEPDLEIVKNGTIDKIKKKTKEEEEKKIK